MQNSCIQRSKLNFLKSIHSCSSLISASSNYWEKSIKSALCECSNNSFEKRNEISESSSLNSGEKKIYFVVSDGSNKSYSKEWTKEENELLHHSYFTLKIKNFTELSKIIQTKSSQQCYYRIKKYEKKNKMKSLTRQDDLKIISLVDLYGRNWAKIANSFPGFTAEMIEERFKMKLDPKLKRTKFTKEEDEKIIALYLKLGNKWKEISSFFPERNINMVKNRFYSFLKKQITDNQTDISTEKISLNVSSYVINNNNTSSNTSFTSFNNEEESIFDQKKENSKEDFYEMCERIFPVTQQSLFGRELSLNLVEDFSSEMTSVSKESSAENEKIKKLFKETYILEEILRKIDTLEMNEEKEMNFKSTIKDNDYCKLVQNKDKIEKLKELLLNRLIQLKEQYADSLANNEKGNAILLEINETLLKLISMAKIKIFSNKKMNKIERKYLEQGRIEVDDIF